MASGPLLRQRCSSAAAVLGATIRTVTLQGIPHGSPAADPGLVQDEHPLLGPAPEPDYRALERNYHRSADYAAMVERYPQLRRSIQSCRGSRLVGGPNKGLPRDPTAVQLQWNRSHGDG
jgi:hypothetical protein